MTNSGVPEIEAVVETSLYTEDLDKIEQFYTDVLGLPVIAKEPGRHVFFRVGKGSVLLAFNPQATLAGGMLPAHGARGPSAGCNGSGSGSSGGECSTPATIEPRCRRGFAWPGSTFRRSTARPGM